MGEIKTYVDTTSRVTDICLKTVNSDRSLEVVSEFIEKEFTETIKEDSNGKPQKITVPKILKKWTKTNIYPFRKVTAEELFELRLSKVPGIVCKDGADLFYTSIPATLRLNGSASNLGSHACGKNCTTMCKGCPRTKDLTVAFQKRIGKDFYHAVEQSWRLEKYPFIVDGIEAFNMEGSNDACLVFSCQDYQVKEKEQRKAQAITNAKLGLAHFVWDDFNGTREEMKARINRNLAQNRDYEWFPH